MADAHRAKVKLSIGAPQIPPCNRRGNEDQREKNNDHNDDDPPFESPTNIFCPRDKHRKMSHILQTQIERIAHIVGDVEEAETLPVVLA